VDDFGTDDYGTDDYLYNKTLSITADTLRGELRACYRFGVDSTVRVFDCKGLPIVPSEFRAIYQDHGVTLRIDADFAMGFYSQDARTRNELQDSGVDCDEAYGDDAGIYPNFVLTGFARLLGDFCDVDWTNVMVDGASMPKGWLSDEFTRLDSNTVRYTSKLDGNVICERVFVDTMAYHRLAPEVLEYHSSDALLEGSSYRCVGNNVDVEWYENELCNMSRLYKMAFLCCPNRVTENHGKSHFDIGFADVYVETGYSYQCGAHGMSGMHTLNITKQGDTLLIGDVVDSGKHDELIAKIYSDYNDTYGFFQEDFQLSNFRLEKDCAVFYWSEYEVAPYMAGFCESAVPYDGNERFFTESFRKLIGR